MDGGKVNAESAEIIALSLVFQLKNFLKEERDRMQFVLTKKKRKKMYRTICIHCARTYDIKTCFCHYHHAHACHLGFTHCIRLVLTWAISINSSTYFSIFHSFSSSVFFFCFCFLNIQNANAFRCQFLRPIFCVTLAILLQFIIVHRSYVQWKQIYTELPFCYYVSDPQRDRAIQERSCSECNVVLLFFFLPPLISWCVSAGTLSWTECGFFPSQMHTLCAIVHIWTLKLIIYF